MCAVCGSDRQSEQNKAGRAKPKLALHFELSATTPKNAKVMQILVNTEVGTLDASKNLAARIAGATKICKNEILR